ncbi:hypothetical protein Micbo1qcDRAFT_207021 [Microdochium bolleyi]|uniref:BTB domain-containing protein n=1 Tax=Microdochium bolleyi TaxID=196109 RepID=A0A136IVI5_9PEZI|nr:hypothetical protein Micbo1qcDRAFT_207021 [Microdochium bolleyi]
MAKSSRCVIPCDEELTARNIIFLKLRYSNYIPVHKDILLSQMENLPDHRTERYAGQMHYIKLEHIQKSTGQALVQYLYTGNVDVEAVLAAAGRSEEKHMCRVAIELLALSNTHEMPGLNEQLIRQLDEYKRKLGPQTILEAVECSTIQPDSSDGSWFRGFMRALLETAYPDLRSFMQSRIKSSRDVAETYTDSSVVTLFMDLMLEVEEKRQAENNSRDGIR